MSGSDLTMTTAMAARAADRTRRRIMGPPPLSLRRPVGGRRWTQLGEDVVDRFDRAIDGGGDDVGQPDAFLDGRGLAPDDQDAPDLPAEAGEHVEHHARAHAVRLERGGGIVAGL